jgi:CheY-like chemotaxis protein
VRNSFLLNVLRLPHKCARRNLARGLLWLGSIGAAKLSPDRSPDDFQEKIMNQANFHCSARPRRSPTDLAVTICVVDRQGGDYRDAASLAKTNGIRFEMVPSGAEALRFSQSNRVDLWVVSTELPGLSGYELCRMLKDRDSKAAVCLVADEPSPAAERGAWSARASMFCCKPGHRELLDQWIERQATASATMAD